MPPKRGRYVTCGEWGLDSLRFLGKYDQVLFITEDGKNIPVQYTGTHLQIMQEQHCCQNCGLKASSVLLVAWMHNPVERYRSFVQVLSENGEAILTVDHIVARSLGGSDDLSNLQVLCERCNKRKSNLTLEEWEEIRHTCRTSRDARLRPTKPYHVFLVSQIERVYALHKFKGPQAARDHCDRLSEVDAIVVMTALNQGLEMVVEFLQSQIKQLQQETQETTDAGKPAIPITDLDQQIGELQLLARHAPPQHMRPPVST